MYIYITLLLACTDSIFLRKKRFSIVGILDRHLTAFWSFKHGSLLYNTALLHTGKETPKTKASTYRMFRVVVLLQYLYIASVLNTCTRKGFVY